MATVMTRVNLLHAHGSPTLYLYTKRGGSCRCISCVAASKARDRGYRKANLPRMRANARAGYSRNRDHILSGQRDFYWENRDRLNEEKRSARVVAKRADPRGYKLRGREAMLRKRYGMTPVEWDMLLKSQASCCAVCEKPYDDRGIWHTDHCHDTGAVRGILCHQCNTGIGLLRDDPDLLRAALRYLSDAS